MKKQSGITLIALIVTAIVLLILAGVSLAMVVGNNGILTQASTSVEKTREAKAKEDVLLAWDSVDSDYWDAWTENSNVEKKDYFTEANLNSYLEGKGVVSNLLYNENGISTLTYTDVETNKSYDISIDTNGNIALEDAGKIREVSMAEAQNKMLSSTKNTIVLDEYGNEIIVPPGFMIRVDDTTNNADSAIEGIVIEDCTEGTTNGNQFVWIPVGKVYYSQTEYKEIRLGRYSGDDLLQPTNLFPSDAEFEIGSYATEYQPTTETPNAKARNINDFYESTTANGGYYLGRYEAGKENDAVVCKAGQTVYDNVTQQEASTLSQTMYVDNYNKGTFSSDLVNSYAWDTAVLFIKNFSTNADAGSYASANKSTSYTVTGGNNDEYCNINDLSGNALEWSTETSSNGSYPQVARGGYYEVDMPVCLGATSDRTNPYGDYFGFAAEEEATSFRPILYLLQTLESNDRKLEDVKITGWVQYGNYFIRKNSDGTIVKVKRGEYINYTYDVASDYKNYYTYDIGDKIVDETIEQTTGFKWRAVGIDDNGQLELISDKVTNAQITLYYQGNVLNSICNLQYINKELGTTARSVSVKDKSSNTNDELIFGTGTTYWLSDTDGYGYSLKYVNSTTIGSHVSHDMWAGGSVEPRADHFRPVVTLPNDIEVITNANENSASNMWTLNKVTEN